MIAPVRLRNSLDESTPDTCYLSQNASLVVDSQSLRTSDWLQMLGTAAGGSRSTTGFDIADLYMCISCIWVVRRDASDIAVLLLGGGYQIHLQDRIYSR